MRSSQVLGSVADEADMSGPGRALSRRPDEALRHLLWGPPLMAVALFLLARVLPHTSCEEPASGLTEGVLDSSLAVFSTLLICGAFWSLWQEGAGMEPVKARSRFRFGAALIVAALFVCGVAEFGSRPGDLLPHLYRIGLIAGIPGSAIALGGLAIASRRVGSLAEMAEVAPGAVPGYLVLLALFTFPALTALMRIGTSGGFCL